MYYEVYADSIFFLQFVMNLYVLLLVNYYTRGTATLLRIVLGAAVGALGSLLTLSSPGPIWVRVFCGSIMTSFMMLLVTFRIRKMKTMCSMVEKTLLCSFCFGGVMRLLLRIFSTGEWEQKSPMRFVLVVLGTIALLLIKLCEKEKKQSSEYFAILKNNDKQVKVLALLDSGNRLTEPISGKPVSVITREIFDSLDLENMSCYRVIPYKSVGCAAGIMDGYLLPELWVNLDGLDRKWKNVYVAVSPDDLSVFRTSGNGVYGKKQEVRMILNPALLKERNLRRRKRQNERIYGIEKYVIEQNKIQNGLQQSKSDLGGKRNLLYRWSGNIAASTGTRGGEQSD